MGTPERFDVVIVHEEMTVGVMLERWLNKAGWHTLALEGVAAAVFTSATVGVMTRLLVISDGVEPPKGMTLTEAIASFKRPPYGHLKAIVIDSGSSNERPVADRIIWSGSEELHRRIEILVQELLGVPEQRST